MFLLAHTAEKYRMPCVVHHAHIVPFSSEDGVDTLLPDLGNEHDPLQNCLMMPGRKKAIVP